MTYFAKSSLCVLLSIAFNCALISMDAAAEDKAPKFHRGNFLAEGHFARVYLSSPVKYNSPSKKRKADNDDVHETVTKRRKHNGKIDFTHEALMQSAIKAELQQNFPDVSTHIPHVVSSGAAWIKMVQVEGVTVRKAKDSLDPLSFLTLFQNLTGLIHRLHQVGYAHEDLSPDNILVNTDDLSSFSLIDFGLAGVLGKHIRTTSGAEGFSAPEMLLYEKTEVHADIYSLGKILDFYFASYDVDKITSLITRMTSDKPTDRPSLTIILADLAELIATPPVMTLREVSSSDEHAGDDENVPTGEPEILGGYSADLRLELGTAQEHAGNDDNLPTLQLETLGGYAADPRLDLDTSHEQANFSTN